jgi:hypothetical protein
LRPLLAAGIAAMIVLAGCGGSSTTTKTETQPRGLPGDWQKGMNYASFTADGYNQAFSDQQLQALAATGTKAVEVVVTWYQDDAQGTGVGPDQSTPSDAAILHAMQTAKGLGMNVVLKPHIDLRDNSFRGKLAPTDVDAWFTSYLGMTHRYADIAKNGGATAYVVGTELTSLAEKYPDKWRAIITEARKRFGGTIIYAANWIDEAEKITFWDAVDVIGIDAYMPLDTGQANPTVDQLIEAWKPFEDRISKLHDKVGKPVIFTELGYQSRNGTALRPAGGSVGAANQVPQARAYDAAFRVWSVDKPWFDGIYWWVWPAEPNQPGAEADFTPQNKLAQHTLERWYAYPPVG